MDHNYNSCTEQNVGLIGKDSEVFGITWMSDGAKCFCMPLVNVLVVCGDVPLVVVDIFMIVLGTWLREVRRMRNI